MNEIELSFSWINDSRLRRVIKLFQRAWRLSGGSLGRIREAIRTAASMFPPEQALQVSHDLFEAQRYLMAIRQLTGAPYDQILGELHPIPGETFGQTVRRSYDEASEGGELFQKLARTLDRDDIDLEITACPQCRGKTQKLSGRCYFCLDCDWDNLETIR